ncbi:MAG TPA: type 4a pilus biogenesis protein PilO [Polyangiaceae bacterium]|nr:type 4a pilus biogenesis protein PilO [Polyangiaceae bacterium]
MAQSRLSKLPIAAKVGVGAALAVLVLVGYYVIFYGEIQSSIKAAENQERQLRDELAEARKNEFAYQKDLAELTDREQRQRVFEKILPANTEYPAFLSSLQNVANATGVSLSAWTPQEETPEQFYSRVPMKLELSGRYHQIAKFFYGVGQLDRIINMENISIMEPKPEGDDIVVKTEVLATAFRMLSEPTPENTDKRGAAQEREGQ